MKKILSIFGTMALTTTASTSIIVFSKKEETKPTQSTAPKQAPPVTAIKLNEQVAKDLGLIDINGNSLVEIGINLNLALATNNSVEWDFIGSEPDTPFDDNIKKITASKLLNPDNKAVSQASEYFLINTLKLTKNATNNTFSKNDADAITVLTSEIKPTVSKKADDSGYEVTGGTFKLQFVKQNVNLGDSYVINLKGNELNIESLFEDFSFKTYHFNKIPKFTLRASKNEPENGIDLYTFLKKDNDVYKKLESLNKLLIYTGDKISIIVVGRTSKNIDNDFFWEEKDELGNQLLVSIKFGMIISTTFIGLNPLK